MDTRSGALRAAIITSGLLLASVAGVACDGEDEQPPPDDAVTFTAYQEFFERCIAIEAMEARLGDVNSELESPGLKESRTNELEAERDGIETERTQAIDDYNSSAASYEEAEFEQAGLPYELTEEGLAICATA